MDASKDANHKLEVSSSGLRHESLPENRRTMALLGLTLLSLLQVKAAIAVDSTVLYVRSGQEAALPCGSVSASDRTCSNINWLYNNILRPTTETLQEVEDGNVRHQSVRAARLSLTTSCSLVISNITAQDAGFYTCRRGTMTDGDARVYLSFLTTAIAVDGTFLYLRPGQEAALPCGLVSASDRTCSNINWLYNNILTTETLQEVEDGNVRHQSVRAARLSLTTSCSLVISNITAQDVGFYTCRRGTITTGDAQVYLSVLTISPASPDADSKRDGNVTLACSLLRHSFLGPCEQGSIRWLDETRTVLLSEGDGFKLLRQTNCLSALTVKRQRGHNRKYTCQYVEEQSVRVEADYTPVFTDSTDWSPLSSIMLVLRVSGLILLIGVTVLIITKKRSKKSLKDKRIPDDGDVTVNYENVRRADGQQSI